MRKQIISSSTISVVSILIAITLESSTGITTASRLHRGFQDRPNIILVMTDDQGYGELSCHGNPVLNTPHLDQLAEQSLRLRDYHVAPMCTPTRGQLLTGFDAARNGAINVCSGRALLRSELLTMADILQYNGYNTGIFGKWHLGDNYPYRPEDRGFQETLWFPSSYIGSLPDYWGNNYNNDTYIHNGKREKYEGYCTDIFFNNAIRWMSASIKEGKSFFTYLPTNTPHWPHIAPDEYIEAIETAFADVSAFSDMEPALKDRLIRYLAMILNIDTNMGELIDFLEKEGIAENTLLIFTTDNGSTFGPTYFNAGMRGMKAQLWEGGHRVPCFIRWPNGGLGKPRDIGGLTQVQDLLPTLIDLCDIDTPVPMKFDGISLAPILRGKSGVPEDRMLVINYSRVPVGFNFPSPHAPSIMKREGAAVLWKHWRLLEDRELYNLAVDPMQQNNVIDRNPEVVIKMRRHLNDWWEEVEDMANEPQRVVIGSEAENPMMITACEWLDVSVDKQIEVSRGVRRNGYWHLNVAEAGVYEFELFRWPFESNTALVDKTDDGTAVPIFSARLFIPGITKNVNEQRPFTFLGERKKINPGEKSVIFTIDLDAGPIKLFTWFDDENGEPLFGAYYVYVNRK